MWPHLWIGAIYQLDTSESTNGLAGDPISSSSLTLSTSMALRLSSMPSTGIPALTFPTTTPTHASGITRTRLWDPFQRLVPLQETPITVPSHYDRVWTAAS